MINWLWVIPWILVFIFYAGWHFGGKVATKKEAARRNRVEIDLANDRNTSNAISELYRHLDNLESKIERIYATKEDKNNG